MVRWLRRNRPTRAELIARKHELTGEIRSLEAEIGRRRARNESTDRAESRLSRLRNLQYKTRHEIDRADP